MFWKKREPDQVVRAYREVFNSEAGKVVIEDMMKTFYTLSSTFDPNPIEMAYKEGERSVVIRILKTINTDPFELKQRLEEARRQE